jgi:S-DNA-T family DNA segregation ATPase FtsK/SpoIIIE
MARGQTKSPQAGPPMIRSARGREAIGIMLLGTGFFCGLSVASLQLGSGSLMGPCGASLGLGLYAFLGLGSYLLAIGFGALAIRLLLDEPVEVRPTESCAMAIGSVAIAILLHLALGSHRLHGYGPGGLLGEYSAELLASLVGRVGAVLVALTGFGCGLVLATPISLRGAVRGTVSLGRHAVGLLVRTIEMIFPEHGDESEGRKQDGPSPRITRSNVEKPPLPLPPKALASKRIRQLDDLEVEKGGVLDTKPEEAAPTELIENEHTERAEIAIEAPVRAAPQIIEPLAPKRAELVQKQPKADYIPAAGGYHLPELTLLDFEAADEDELDRQGMLTLAERLKKTLADYGVKGEVVQIHPGPVVTMYEFVPAPGTKLSKITTLSNDLAMSLQAMRVRIVAPIPGKGSVGIEVPNKSRATVYLREILTDENVQQAKSKLTLGLGKDIAGVPVAVDLGKMPHLLVAGTTGSGKSVAVNGMICSLLFNATPDEVRLLMIDPKMVELSIYEGIPHLLLPVVTDPKKANLALKWAVDEMERRYEQVSKAGVRDLLAYNKKVEKELAAGPPRAEEKKIKIYIDGEEGQKREVEVAPDEAAVVAAGGVITSEVRDEISAAHAALQKLAADAGPPPRKLPYIVIIIDEFADLMMVAPKDIETSVARIAQKARAVGIHLIVATQRPSVDVITGLIKANFPSRVAFQVASKIDSRTILDQQGAENLLGHGDMLFTDRGQALRRVHGALVTDIEIRRMVDFLKEQGKPIYDMEILKPRGDEDGEGALPEAGEQDEMYDLAVRLVCETRMASVSMIQRRLQIGFNRASRLVERMERDGIVGAANGSKPREVLAQAV